MGLTGHQRRHLAKLAHPLKPLVMVGSGGLSEGVIGAVKDALEKHELIKVKFISHKERRQTLAAEMAASTQADLVLIIGHTAVLYKPARELKKRRISIPS